MDIPRTLANHIIETSKSFKVLLLTGPRQIGKTTLLKSLAGTDRSYITLGDLDLRTLAEQDPATFINRLSFPTLIDEVQYAPSLFSYIKMKVDNDKLPGQFWLTGSQQFAMMKNISDSLAGRVAILDMLGISLAEEENRVATTPFVPTEEVLLERQHIAKPIGVKDIYYKIWRGSFPDVVVSKGKNWQTFYASYLTSYTEKDVRDYLKVDDLIAFRKFMQVAARRTGQMLNYSAMASDVGVAVKTIKSWFNVLQATGLVALIQPYFNNLTKRAVKTPKFHFLDTGLCCYLTGWVTPEVLEKGAMAGSMLESYVVLEIIKSHIHNGKKPSLCYYTDKDKRQIDLIIEQAGELHPIEVKKSASIRNMHFKGFDFLNSTKAKTGHGAVICLADRLLPITDKVDAVPVGYI
jgi:predicted AAA+ superfamily ATPase